MKLKQFALLTLLAGVLFSAVGIIVPFIALQIYISQNGAIGIIGGVDTPTYEFVILTLMNGWPFVVILFGITLIVSALFCLIFSKTVKNNCSIKTSVSSLGLSAVGAVGLACAFIWFSVVSFGEMSKHPISYPFSIILGLISLFVFIILIVMYLKFRKKSWSIKGFCIDIITSIIYLPSFFYAFSYLYNTLS